MTCPDVGNHGANHAVDFYFGSVHHLSTWYHSEGELSAAEIGDHYARLLLDALRPSPSS